MILEDRPSGPNRHLLIEITELTGAPGTLSFSLPIDLRPQSTGLTCGATSCTFAGVVAPDVVIGHIHTSPEEPLTIELLRLVRRRGRLVHITLTGIQRRSRISRSGVTIAHRPPSFLGTA